MASSHLKVITFLSLLLLGSAKKAFKAQKFPILTYIMMIQSLWATQVIINSFRVLYQ